MTHSDVLTLALKMIYAFRGAVIPSQLTEALNQKRTGTKKRGRRKKREEKNSLKLSPPLTQGSHIQNEAEME